MDILVRHLGSAFGREECLGGREGKRRLTDTGSDFLTLSLLSFDMERQSMARTDRTSIAACTRIRLLPRAQCPSHRVWAYSAPLFVVSRCLSMREAVSSSDDRTRARQNRSFFPRVTASLCVGLVSEGIGLPVPKSCPILCPPSASAASAVTDRVDIAFLASLFHSLCFPLLPPAAVGPS